MLGFSFSLIKKRVELSCADLCGRSVCKEMDGTSGEKGLVGMSAHGCADVCS